MWGAAKEDASIDLVVDGKSSKWHVGPERKKSLQTESKKAGSLMRHAFESWSRPPVVPPALFMSDPARIRCSISVTSAGTRHCTLRYVMKISRTACWLSTGTPWLRRSSSWPWAKRSNRVRQSSIRLPGFAAGGATARGAVVAAARPTTAETGVCESLRRESTARQRTDHIDTRPVGALV